MSTAQRIQQCFEKKQPIHLNAMSGAEFKRMLREMKKLNK